MKEDILNPLDGRYKNNLADLRSACAETAFAAARVRAESAWLLVLESLKLPEFKPFCAKERSFLEKIYSLSSDDLEILEKIERQGHNGRPATNHDVKAVEYFMADKLTANGFKAHTHWIHFALTSEDINSLAYGQILSDTVEKVLLPALETLRKELAQRSKKYAGSVMLARTHGQPAVPTTYGKELKVFEIRLARQIAQLKKQQISCKAGGAIGSYNAHLAAYPKVNWPKATQSLVTYLNKGRKIKLFLSPVSTQIDNRDSYAELFDNLRRINTILLDLSQDMWRYISDGLVKQKVIAGEVGSSTMPQKVNPIDFENAEGNLGLANALLTFFSQKLPVSRLQRDLSDSTVLRNMAVAFGYCLLAYRSLLKGLKKTDFDKNVSKVHLLAHPEILAEAYQTILRSACVSGAYEKLKSITRNQHITMEGLCQFVKDLDIEDTVKQKMLALDVLSYIGLASKQAGGEK